MIMPQVVVLPTPPLPATAMVWGVAISVISFGMKALTVWTQLHPYRYNDIVSYSMHKFNPHFTENKKLGKKYTEFTIKDIIDIVHVWTKSVVDLDKLLYEDAKKEFNLISRTGFGTDGDEETKAQDFYNVRGKFEENPFVKEVLRHIEVKTALGEELINRIQHLG
jgi:hypothetical protein